MPLFGTRALHACATMQCPGCCPLLPAGLLPAATRWMGVLVKRERPSNTSESGMPGPQAPAPEPTAPQQQQQQPEGGKKDNASYTNDSEVYYEGYFNKPHKRLKVRRSHGCWLRCICLGTLHYAGRATASINLQPVPYFDMCCNIGICCVLLPPYTAFFPSLLLPNTISFNGWRPIIALLE